MESFSRKLVYRFIKSAAISNNLLYGRRVCSNKQPFLSIVGPAYSRGEILFLGYKWRLEKCLHFIKFKSKKLSTSTYGYYCGCSKARSSCKRNTARRKRTAPTPENLNRLFLETPVPGEPCRRGKPHPCDGPENKGPRE